MEEFGRKRFVALACYVVVYLLAYAVVGLIDNAYDAAVATNEIARHDAELVLSTTFSLSAVLGLASLWPYEAWSWWGAAAVGVMTACAAGGFHVLNAMWAWLPLALAAGLAAGLAFLMLAKRRPIACVLLSIEVALVVVQAVFIVQFV